MSRFDYVKCDEIAVEDQAKAKRHAEVLEKLIDNLNSPRAKELALNKLEECYMWIGKAIRDDQIERGGDDIDQPARDNK